MAHASPGARRATPEAQWTYLRELEPDVLLAQEAVSPSAELLPDYDVAFAPRPQQRHGLVIGVRRSSGSALDEQLVGTDRDDLAVWAVLDGERVLLVSTHVDSRRNAWHALDRAALLSCGGLALVGGDFNAGPSVGRHNPCDYAQQVDLCELTTSQPEINTLRRPRQRRDLQIDHIFGRGYLATAPTRLAPVAEPDGLGLSDHNILTVEVRRADI
jgi:endonuclease/exonuclease/phosphatase family metal-dependent hydrolase